MSEPSEMSPQGAPAQLYEVSLRITQYRCAVILIEAHSEEEARELACAREVDDALLVDSDVEADDARLLSDIIEEGDESDE